MSMRGSISGFLATREWLLNLWAFTAAFTAYFFMYMFRKPFTAAAYESVAESAWDNKSTIVSAQVIGYLCSKLIGIRVISQMPATGRAVALLILILLAQAALLLFAVLPAPWHILAIFLNGLPLGMVFGLVLGFLEGRRMTEALVAGLCASFILAGGFAKTFGQWTLDLLTIQLQWSLEHAERWMPFCVGCLFLLPFAFTTWMLSEIPAPSDADCQLRSERTAMTSSQRWTMLRRYGMGLAAISLFYLLATILRSLRDDFAPQILSGMGAATSAGDYSWIDIQVAGLVLTLTGLTALVRSNKHALQLALLVSFLGFALIGVALTPIVAASPIAFMVLVGAGLYLPYVAVHTTVFERLIALTRDRGNIGFLMYVVDSLGYLGYVVILLVPREAILDLTTSKTSFYESFRWICLIASVISMAAVGVALLHFSRFQEKSPTSPNR